MLPRFTTMTNFLPSGEKTAKSEEEAPVYRLWLEDEPAIRFIAIESATVARLLASGADTSEEFQTRPDVCDHAIFCNNPVAMSRPTENKTRLYRLHIPVSPSYAVVQKAKRSENCIDLGPPIW